MESDRCNFLFYFFDVAKNKWVVLDKLILQAAPEEKKKKAFTANAWHSRKTWQSETERELGFLHSGNNLTWCLYNLWVQLSDRVVLPTKGGARLHLGDTPTVNILVEKIFFIRKAFGFDQIKSFLNRLCLLFNFLVFSLSVPQMNDTFVEKAGPSGLPTACVRTLMYNLGVFYLLLYLCKYLWGLKCKCCHIVKKHNFVCRGMDFWTTIDQIISPVC